MYLLYVCTAMNLFVNIQNNKDSENNIELSALEDV